MPISTNAAIEHFGSTSVVTKAAGTAAVVDGAFSGLANAVVGDWANTDDAPTAAMVLTCAFASAPAAYSTVGLYARLMNIDGSFDQMEPDADFGHVYLGAFPLNNSTSTQYIAIDIRLPNTQPSQYYQFQIRNNAGQTMSAGWTLKITPKTIGPHA